MHKPSKLNFCSKQTVSLPSYTEPGKSAIFAMVIVSDHILLMLFLLLSLKACLSSPYSVEAGCSDYRTEDSISATLDSDVDSDRSTIRDPRAVPEAFFFYLFDQQFWGSREILDMEMHISHMLKSGGHASLQVAVVIIAVKPVLVPIDNYPTGTKNLAQDNMLSCISAASAAAAAAFTQHTAPYS